MVTSNAQHMLQGKQDSKIWRQSKIIALLMPGKDSAIPNNYIPISILCHTYKLYEQIILNRIAPLVEQRLIKEQAGFSPGKSCTSELVNLTQYIEDDYQRSMITGTVFVDQFAVYDTANHIILMHKLYNINQDSPLCMGKPRSISVRFCHFNNNNNNNIFL